MRKRGNYVVKLFPLSFLSIVNGYFQENYMVALDHPVYTCAYVEKEQAEEEGREQNETWKGYVRTATIRADQEPVGALVFVFQIR